MSKHAKTKEELVESIRTAHQLLEKKYSKLNAQQMVWPGSMDNWSVKDILAHLVDWEQRFITWYQAGLRKEVPKIPAPGMTWRDLPKLNKAGYEQHKDESLETVLARYEKSYQEILALIEGMQEREIFEKNYYAWTGKSPLLVWIAANTSEHYDWACKQIRTTVVQKGCP